MNTVVTLARSALMGALAAIVVYALAFGQGLVFPPLLGEVGTDAFWAQLMALIAFVVVAVGVYRDGGSFEYRPR